MHIRQRGVGFFRRQGRGMLGFKCWFWISLCVMGFIHAPVSPTQAKKLHSHLLRVYFYSGTNVPVQTNRGRGQVLKNHEEDKSTAGSFEERPVQAEMSCSLNAGSVEISYFNTSRVTCRRVRFILVGFYGPGVTRCITLQTCTHPGQPTFHVLPFFQISDVI